MFMMKTKQKVIVEMNLSDYVDVRTCTKKELVNAIRRIRRDARITQSKIFI